MSFLLDRAACGSNIHVIGGRAQVNVKPHVTPTSESDVRQKQDNEGFDHDLGNMLELVHTLVDLYLSGSIFFGEYGKNCRRTARYSHGITYCTTANASTMVVHE